MLIPVVRWPGVWLDGLSDQEAHETIGLLHLMQSSLDEAAVAVHLFEAAQEAALSEMHVRGDWEIKNTERASVEQVLRIDRPTGPPGADNWWEEEREFQAKVDHEVNRKRWLSGRWPDSYQRQLPFLYARCFLYALDGIGKAIGVLTSETSSSQAIRSAGLHWVREFPDLNGVRNSSHHPEDRIRNLKGVGKKIDLKPVQNLMVSAPSGGVMFLGTLMGDRFGSTMSDGHCGEVAVNCASLRTAADVFQQALDSFEWHGPAQFKPSD